MAIEVVTRDSPARRLVLRPPAADVRSSSHTAPGPPSATTRSGASRPISSRTGGGSSPHDGTSRMGPSVSAPPATASVTTSARARYTEALDKNTVREMATAVSIREAPKTRPVGRVPKGAAKAVEG